MFGQRVVPITEDIMLKCGLTIVTGDRIDFDKARVPFMREQ